MDMDSAIQIGLGVIMFTVCGILDVKTSAYARAALPFFLALAVFFALLLTLPQLSLVLPNAIMN